MKPPQQQVGDINAAATNANHIPGKIQQPQIPGFAKPNAPIPIPMMQPGVSPTGTGSLSNSNVGQPATAPIIPLAGGNFVVNNNSVAAAGLLSNNVIPKGQPPSIANIPTVESIEQRVPEISEWKPEDANNSLKFNAAKSRVRTSGGSGGGGNGPKSIGKDGLESNEWHDTFSYAATTNKTSQESAEWNNGLSDDAINADDSNTWSGNGNQRYPQNRQNFGRYNNRTNRSDGGNNRNANGNPNNFNANNPNASGTANGYRNGNRSNSSYQSNGGAVRNNNGGSGGGGNGSTNTYYRNNDSYYQNGGANGAGGNGNYRDKPENYTRPNNYRQRDNRDGQDARDNSATFKNGGGGGGGGPALPQRNNTNVGNSQRLNVTADGNDRGQRLPNTGARTTNGLNKGQGGGAGGNGGNLYRPVGAPTNRSPQQQSAPINA